MSNDTPEDAAKQLRRDAARLSDGKLVEKILNQCRMAMLRDVRENFATVSDPDGRKWPGLKFPRVRGGDRPLIDTGALRASIVGKHANHIEEVTQNSVTIGTTRPGANLMQSGGTVKPVNGKALAIPLTKEALRAGSPRRFGKPLVMLWRTGAKSGVLAEVDRDAQKATKGEKASSVVVRSQSATARQLARQVERIRKRMNRTKSKAGKAKLKKQIATLRVKQSRASAKAADAYRKRQKSRDKRKAKVLTLQYALVKSVTVPARPFVGFGPRLIAKLDTILRANVRSAVGIDTTTEG